jgi:pimeloyl-ACP methyl ester carboxylesterase
MNNALAAVAVLLSALALYLPTRSQAFTRVPMEGGTIRLHVAGRGTATVVFENGGGATLEMWGKVQPDVSAFAKTVSYDRGGSGLSKTVRASRDGRRIADVLERALQAAGITPPYILVGASIGGRYSRIYAGMHPDDVAALVLVDPTPDIELLDDPALEQARTARLPNELPVFLIDAISPLEVPFLTDTVQARRLRNRWEIDAESAEHRRWIATIPGGRLIVTNRSGHNVPIEQPGLVVETIRQAVKQVSRPQR